MPMTRSNNYTLELVDLTDDTTVTPAGTNIQLLQPPKGFVYEVIQLGYMAPDPGGSGSGTHKLDGKFTGEYSNLLSIVSTFGNFAAINTFGFVGDSSEAPSALSNQYHIMHGNVIAASNSLPFVFTYTNDTDVNQAGTRILKLVVRKYREA